MCHIDNSNLFHPISWNPSNQLTSIIDIIKDRPIRLEIEHNQDKWITENIEDTTIESTRRVVIDSRHLTGIGTDMRGITIYILKMTTMMKAGIRVITITETGIATIVERDTGSIKPTWNHLYATRKATALWTTLLPLTPRIVLLKAIVNKLTATEVISTSSQTTSSSWTSKTLALDPGNMVQVSDDKA